MRSSSRNERQATLPKLILMPGMDGTGILFKPLVEALPEEVACTVLSYPQDDASCYSDLLPVVLERLPPTSTFILIGESFSGPLALMAAAAAPAGLRGVVLCASFIRNPLTLVPAFCAPLAARPLFRLWPLSTRFTSLVSSKKDPLKQLIAKAKERVTSRGLSSRARSALRVDVTHELASCPVPVIYLAGKRDRIVGKRNHRDIISQRDDVGFFTLETSHLVLQEAPREAAALILDFARMQAKR